MAQKVIVNPQLQQNILPADLYTQIRSEGHCWGENRTLKMHHLLCGINKDLSWHFISPRRRGRCMPCINFWKAGTSPEARIQGHLPAPDLGFRSLNEILRNNQDDRWQQTRMTDDSFPAAQMRFLRAFQRGMAAGLLPRDLGILFLCRAYYLFYRMSLPKTETTFLYSPAIPTKPNFSNLVPFHIKSKQPFALNRNHKHTQS